MRRVSGLDEIPGVGPALATALVASVADPQAFRSGRYFSAWIGLVPNQHSSGGRDKLGNISKRGDRYLRSLFTAGALAVIRYAKVHGTQHRPWLSALLARRPTKVAAIALANKIAKMAWAMMARGERYKEPVALADDKELRDIAPVLQARARQHQWLTLQVRALISSALALSWPPAAASSSRLPEPFRGMAMVDRQKGEPISRNRDPGGMGLAKDGG